MGLSLNSAFRTLFNEKSVRFSANCITYILGVLFSTSKVPAWGLLTDLPFLAFMLKPIRRLPC